MTITILPSKVFWKVLLSIRKLIYASSMSKKARRESEALRLYEPLPFQDQYHACHAKRSSYTGRQSDWKISLRFVEDARAATGQDPYGKYPKENGIMVCLGMDEGTLAVPFINIYFALERSRLSKITSLESGVLGSRGSSLTGKEKRKLSRLLLLFQSGS